MSTIIYWVPPCIRLRWCNFPQIQNYEMQITLSYCQLFATKLLPNRMCFLLNRMYLLLNGIYLSVELAVQYAHEGIMANHGQNCCAGSRTFVQSGIYDQFVQMSVTMAEFRIVGDPWDDTTQQGPQVMTS